MITNRSYYGISALVYLAVNSRGKYIGVREIAARQNLPIRFLELVFSRLRSSEIVKSTRGAAGGYQLSRSPEEISLAEIITVCEGSAEFVLPATVTERVGTDDPIGGTLVAIMNEQFAVLHKNLRAITLADIIRSSGLAAEMYWI
ncbi:MAG: Rrf2 family transcriptional regulator [candidate division Zixibacteria bacterium]|nr:Rrf2 family transcriptional regulator [candidate division Zixibacteria bacterium]